jgi:hypothetical protein
MRLRQVATALVGLLIAGALAGDAMAQRRDRDDDRRGGRDRDRGDWVLLGEQRVGFRVDRDVIRINQSEDWYRTRAFKTLHFMAEGSDIHMMSVRLVYLNGFAEDFRVDRMIRDGRDLPIELRGERSFLRQVEMVYRSRPNFGGQALIKLYGEPSRRGPPGPPPVAGRGDWEEIGCKDVAIFGKDRDTIRVSRSEGRFKAIRLHVRGADVEMLDLKVIYGNGQPDDIRVRHFIRQGERTQALELKGHARVIDRVEMVYRTVPNFKGLAKVCVEGLQ